MKTVCAELWLVPPGLSLRHLRYAFGSSAGSEMRGQERLSVFCEEIEEEIGESEEWDPASHEVEDIAEPVHRALRALKRR